MITNIKFIISDSFKNDDNKNKISEKKYGI